MRKLRILLITALFVTVFAACNEQGELMPSEPEFVNVEIPDMHKTQHTNGRTLTTGSEIHEIEVKILKDDGTEVLGKMKFTIPDEGDETLQKFEMSSNLFENTGLTPDFWINYQNNSTENGRVASSSCIADCNKEFTNEDGSKKKGRGWCKAGCWAETAAKVATAAAAVAAVIVAA